MYKHRKQLSRRKTLDWWRGKRTKQHIAVGTTGNLLVAAEPSAWASAAIAVEGSKLMYSVWARDSAGPRFRRFYKIFSGINVGDLHYYENPPSSRRTKATRRKRSRRAA